jgi:hypothetical protein
MYSITSGATISSMAFQTPFPALEPPNKTVMKALITGVPPTVLVELVDKQSRSSLASEFAAGNTPAWYENLPDAAKSYIEGIGTQTASGALTATTQWTPTATPNAGGAQPGDGGTSSGFAAQQTGSPAVAAAAAAAAGFMGVVLAL